MMYRSYYNSPIGKIILTSNKNKLTGLWFESSRFIDVLEKIRSITIINDDLKIFQITKNWLDKYFNGENPDIKKIPIELHVSDFRLKVLEILKNIPYGKTITYGDIAKIIGQECGIKKMSAQAV